MFTAGFVHFSQLSSNHPWPVFVTEETQERCFTGTVKDGPVFERMATALCTDGLNRTKVQVITKVKSLQKRFHNLVDQYRKSGNGRMDWTYYNLCYDLWGTSPLAQPLSVSGVLEPTSLSRDIYEASLPSGSSAALADGSHASLHSAMDDQDESHSDGLNVVEGETEAHQEQASPAPEPDTQSKSKRCQRGVKLTKSQLMHKEVQELIVTMDKDDAERDHLRMEAHHAREDEFLRALQERDQESIRMERERRDQQMAGIGSVLQELNYLREAVLGHSAAMSQPLPATLAQLAHPYAHHYVPAPPLQYSQASAMPHHSTPSRSDSSHTGTEWDSFASLPTSSLHLLD